MFERQTRREFLKTIGIASFSMAAGAGCSGIKRSPSEQSMPSKPNIILIMADDLGYAGLGCYGQTLIQTPRIDQMAREGIRFTDFYAANTVCVPSRCGLITGRHPGHAAIRDNYPPHVDINLENGGGYMRGHPEWAWPPNVTTLGRVLKDAGYKTAQFGKLEAGIPMPAGKMTEHGIPGWDFAAQGLHSSIIPPYYGETMKR